MSFSFSSLVRLIVVVTLGTTTLAIGLSKLDPPKPEWRTRVVSKYSNLNEYFLNITDRTPRWLDAETGQVISHPLEDGDVFEAASCAPWVDDKGQYQVAGRWSSRTRMGHSSISTDFGIARYTFPGGKLLDHVSTEIVPVGPPCWFPGYRARILFAGGDGELYHYAFEADAWDKKADPLAERDAKPTSLKWRCPKPGLGNVFMSDLTWPEAPGLHGYVVVSLRQQSADSGLSHCFTRTTLWWLKLDHAGTEILDAGRLLIPEGQGRREGSFDQRTPTIGTLPGGKFAVAYLSEKGEKQGWDLRLAPIAFEGDHHVPRAHESNSLVLATDCQPAHPAFSADGRWINAIAVTSDSNGRIIRIPVAEVFSPSS